MERWFEPTSALDPETEAALMITLQHLMKGRTTFIVTHRIRAVHRMARIVVLSGGRVVEDGWGTELRQTGGLYTRLYESAGGKPGSQRAVTEHVQE